MRQFTADEVAETLEEWARLFSPSRFMVYGIIDDPDYGGYDGEVIAWGLGFHDHILVQGVDTRMTGRFRSVDSLRRRMFRKDRDIRLIWIDPEPTVDG